MRTKYIDLHLHLDGAITAKAAMELAEVQGISLPAKTEKELEKLKQEEQEQQAAVNTTKVWLDNFSRRKLTIKQLTREVLVELIDKIYVYPDQKIDIYFKFASEKNSVVFILR